MREGKWIVEVPGWPAREYDNARDAALDASILTSAGHKVTRYAPCDGVTCFGHRKVTHFYGEGA